MGIVGEGRQVEIHLSRWRLTAIVFPGNEVEIDIVRSRTVAIRSRQIDEHRIAGDGESGIVIATQSIGARGDAGSGRENQIEIGRIRVGHDAGRHRPHHDQGPAGDIGQVGLIPEGVHRFVLVQRGPASGGHFIVGDPQTAKIEMIRQGEEFHEITLRNPSNKLAASQGRLREKFSRPCPPPIEHESARARPTP